VTEVVLRPTTAPWDALPAFSEGIFRGALPAPRPGRPRRFLAWCWRLVLRHMGRPR
jgi:hypothetical protein